MSDRGRIGLVVATLAMLVVAFVALSSGGDDNPKPVATVTAPTITGTTTGTATAATRPPPAPSFETIRVKAGGPIGGIKTITLRNGDRARIRVSSPDTSDEIHLHGYDLMKDLAAGGSARFSFEAKIEGIFEIELERAGTQIGKLVVEP